LCPLPPPLAFGEAAGAGDGAVGAFFACPGRSPWWCSLERPSAFPCPCEPGAGAPAVGFSVGPWPWPWPWPCAFPFAVGGVLKNRCVVTGVAGAAGAATCTGADGARRTTTGRARRCTGRALVAACGRCDTKCSARVATNCAGEGTFPTGSEARSLAGAGRSAATRPAAPPIAGNRGVGSPWPPTPGSRKTESAIPIPAASVAGTVGER
jgi:hypothetical protein